MWSHYYTKLEEGYWQKSSFRESRDQAGFPAKGALCLLSDSFLKPGETIMIIGLDLQAIHFRFHPFLLNFGPHPSNFPSE